PPPDAGTSDTWTVGALGAGATGQITVRGFFGNGTVSRNAQTRFRIADVAGTAFATETTRVLATPPLAVGRLAPRKTPLKDIGKLQGRFTAAGLDPTGQPVEVSILGPGNVAHTTTLTLSQLDAARPGHFTFLGDVPGNGRVTVALQARGASDWGIGV